MLESLNYNLDFTPHGRDLLEEFGPMPEGLLLLMDRAYEGNETRQLVLDLGMFGGSDEVQPPATWKYNRALHKKCNEIERVLRGLKGFGESSPASRNGRRIPLLCAYR